MATSPLPSWGARRGQNSYVTPAFLGVPNARRGEKSEVVTSPLPFQGPKRGHCYATPAFSGVPNAKRADKFRSGYLTPAFSGAQKRVELLRNCYITSAPVHYQGSPTPSAGKESEVATSPLPSRGHKRGRNCYVTPAFSGVPIAKRGDKIQTGCLTPAFLGAQKGAELLRNTCILGVPNAKRGDKIRSGYLTPAFSGA